MDGGGHSDDAARAPGADRGDGALSRALALLDAVAAEQRPVRFVDLLNRGGWPKATLHRLLRALVAERMLAYDEATQRYAPGLRLVRLGHAAWARASLGEIARPVLDALAAETGETLHLAQLDDGQVLYIDKRDARRRLEMFSDAGKVGPAYCTGVGKAMLAFLAPEVAADALSKQSFHRYTGRTLDRVGLEAELDAIRARGLAFDREEHEPGIICVAAPILATGGRLLGALSVTSATTRRGLDELAALGPRLVAAAADIAAAAERRQSPAVAPAA
jgi:DNA-binding IclR family transcriptional regulator